LTGVLARPGDTSVMPVMGVGRYMAGKKEGKENMGKWYTH
jgi:hypothetical protein